MKHVFVYGTLKRGYGNHRYHLAGAEFLGTAKTVLPEFVMKDTGGFPVVFHKNDLPTEPAAKVSGEVYAVQDEHIVSMDRLESNGSMFVRTKHTVAIEGFDECTEVELYLGVPAYWEDYIEKMPAAARVDDAYTWG
jgi:gamma-glutamylcyclotransferase (GGCT)/AIG2-like uncharacterized protein YtfP